MKNCKQHCVELTVTIGSIVGLVVVVSAGLMPTEARGNYLPEAPYLRETKTVRPI